MAKLVAVHCKSCKTKHGEFPSKQVPVAFTCTTCGALQMPEAGREKTKGMTAIEKGTAMHRALLEQGRD